MIPVGATVYIAPGIEDVKYLKSRISEGALLLGYYMMGKITRYTNDGSKVGIEFEFKIWTGTVQASNHGTGKPGYCAYIPKEYVKEIHPNKIEWFRDNIATKQWGFNKLVWKKLSSNDKLLLDWVDQAPELYPISLDTNGWPELPKVKPTLDWIQQSIAKREQGEQERIQFNQYRRNYIAGYDPYHPVGGGAKGMTGSIIGIDEARGFDSRSYEKMVMNYPSRGKSDFNNEVMTMAQYYGNIPTVRELSDDTINRKRAAIKDASDYLTQARNKYGYSSDLATAMAWSLMTYGTSGRPFSFNEPPTDEELHLLNI